MTDNIIEFKPKASKGFRYMTDDNDILVGITGKNFKMMFLEGEDGFLFNDRPISREALVAFIWASGLWEDVQRNDQED